MNKTYPPAVNPALVGTYPALTESGGGYFWDAVLEYRVWCHPERGAPDRANGSDYFEAFATYEEALAFSRRRRGAEEPLALVLQEEWINEPKPGVYVHRRDRRVTEWLVEFLDQPRRTARTIPDFLAARAPAAQLETARRFTEGS